MLVALLWMEDTKSCMKASRGKVKRITLRFCEYLPVMFMHTLYQCVNSTKQMQAGKFYKKLNVT